MKYEVRNRLLIKVLLWWLLTLACSFIAVVLILFLRFGEVGVYNRFFNNKRTYEDEMTAIREANEVVAAVEGFEVPNINADIGLEYLIVLKQNEKIIIDYNVDHESLDTLKKNSINNQEALDEVLRKYPFHLLDYDMTDENVEVYLYDLNQLRSIYMFRYAIQVQFYVFAVAILLNISYVIRIIRRTRKPLLAVHEALQSYKEDDFSFRLPQNKPRKVIDVMNSNINEMAEALEKNKQSRLNLEKHRLEFIAKISHDTKTPLASIRAHAEGFRDGLVDTESKRIRYADNIINKVHAIDYLINELSLYSNLSDGIDQYKFTNVLVDEYVSDVIEELRYDYEQIDIELESKKKGNIVTIDPNKFYRVINNIVNNSVKYAGKEEVTLKVIIDEFENHVRITFRDNGVGINLKDIEDLFISFKRGEASRNPNQPGTGLGLAIVKTIVNKHHGEVTLASELDQYFEVVITLPKGS